VIPSITIFLFRSLRKVLQKQPSNWLIWQILDHFAFALQNYRRLELLAMLQGLKKYLLATYKKAN